MTFTVVHVSRGREWRGGERQVALLAREFARRGIPELVATARGSVLAASLEPLGLAHELPWRIALDPRALAGLLRLLTTRRRERLVLHAHDSHALVLAGLAARRFRLPLVATRRSTTRPRRGGWWGRADSVVALSRAVERALIEGGVRPDRVTIIPSGLDLPALSRRAEDATGCVVPDEPYILTVGALTIEKGHAALIRAHAALERPPLLLIAGDGAERASLQSVAEALGSAARIRWLGEVADPAPLIGSARLLVQPSLREALGTAVLEALALGTPVVASKTGGLAELLAGGIGRLVAPGDATALAAAITAELAQPGRRPPVPEIVERHDIRSVADQLMRVYRSATGG